MRILSSPLAFILTATAHSDGLRLESVSYPFLEKTYSLSDQQQDLEMAYMEVPAEGDTVRGNVLLLHGKNFSGSYLDERL